MTVRPGQSTDVIVHVRNFRPREQTHRIEFHAPPGLTVDPPDLVGTVGENSRKSFPIRVSAGPQAPEAVSLVALDITVDGQRYGERFDFVVQVQPTPTEP